MNVLPNFKQILLIVLFLGFAKAEAHSLKSPCTTHQPLQVLCDLCGCSTSSGSFGFGTLSNANFVGVRYIYQNFESRNGIFEDSPLSKETFNTYQVWAQIPINDSFYVTASLPYQDLTRDFNNIKENLNGIGDANIIGWYKHVFYKKEDETVINFSGEKIASGHSLQFGLGVKLPTGEFEQRLTDNINPGFQVGTGSVDGIFSVGYNYGSDTFGVNTLLSYYLKGENKNDYQFGDQFSYAVNFFTAIPKEKMNIMPFVGLSGDRYDTITQYGETLKDTDGSILNASIGSELAIEKFIFGASYTLPVSQNLFGDNVQSKQRLSLYVNFAL